MTKEFTKLEQPVIIATKGLPCTGKSEIARLIALWAKCPVFYIDQFLDTLSLEKGYTGTAELLPSPEEAERLHHLSFDALCKAASHTLQWGVDSYQWPRKCIVVKARLCSAFELDRLLQLARDHGCGMLLIIEFRMKNEYRFRLRLEHKVELWGQKEWYKPRSWKDIEKAKDDYEAENCDLHLLSLLDRKGDGLPQVTRLVLDPFDNLYLVPNAYLPSKCQRIINFLLCRVEVGDLFVESRYATVQFGEVDRYLREKDIRGPRSKVHNNKYLCNAHSKGYYCKFKYWEELEDDVDDEGKPYYCGVCEELVISGQPAYGCQTCTLTLHKSCAELADDFTLEGYQDIEILRYYPKFLPWQHACKSCLEGGKHFSHGCDSCKFQTHLKCQALPTILTHDCHEHSLHGY